MGLGGNLVTTTILFTTINAQEKAVLKTEVTVVSVVALVVEKTVQAVW